MAFKMESGLKFWTGWRKSNLLGSAKVEGSILLHCVGNAFSGNDNVVSRACHNSQVFNTTDFFPHLSTKFLMKGDTLVCFHIHKSVNKKSYLWSTSVSDKQDLVISSANSHQVKSMGQSRFPGAWGILL